VNGQINEVVRYSDNGTDQATQVLDNDASSSRFRILGEGKVSDDFKIKTAFEFDLEVNPRDEVDQSTNFNLNSQVGGGANFDVRKAEVIFDHKRFGRFYLGQGDTFSNKAIEADLSGATLAVGDASFDDDSLDFTQLGENVGDVFDPLDGLSRQTRIRYDSPSFGGFRIGATYVTDRTYDIGAEYSTKDLAGFAIKARAAYFAFLDSGAVNPATNATAWGIKGGYQNKFFDFGKTAFAVDYQRTNGTPEAEDFATVTTNQLEGYSIGVQVTQKIDKASTEVYAGYRLYSVESDFDDDGVAITNVDNIHVVAAGARVKF